MSHPFTSALRAESHTHKFLSKAPRNPSTIVIGDGRTHARIYKIQRKDGYPSYQAAWYEFGKRQTKTFADLEAAKFFAQQKVDALLSGRIPHDAVRYRDIEMLRDCETRARQYGVSLVTAIEEWSAARQFLGKHSIVEATRIYMERHANIREEMGKLRAQIPALERGQLPFPTRLLNALNEGLPKRGRELWRKSVTTPKAQFVIRLNFRDWEKSKSHSRLSTNKSESRRCWTRRMSSADSARNLSNSPKSSFNPSSSTCLAIPSRIPKAGLFRNSENSESSKRATPRLGVTRTTMPLQGSNGSRPTTSSKIVPS